MPVPAVLVGDMIVALRELAADPCFVIPAPSTSGASAVTQPGSSPFGSVTQTCYMVCTWITQWGESAPSAELNISVDLNHQPFLANLGPAPPGVLKVRTYFGIAAGQEDQYVDQTVTSGNIFSGPALTLTNGIAGVPPIRNRAYVPDSDGRFASAFTVYRWLNEALSALGQRVGGIPDTAGVQSQQGKGMYQLPGLWRSIDHAWYDGWIMDLGNKNQIYYRNRIATSISGMMVIHKNADVVVSELFPQPNRTGGADTLSANITASASSIPLTSSGAGFVLPMGLALVNGTEIISYSQISGGSLTGCLRGLGGTIAAAASSGQAVTELNIRYTGRRLHNPYTYTVGSASSTLFLPSGWEMWIPQYMLSRFREAEGERQMAASIRKELLEEAAILARANRQLAGPRQIGSGPMVGEVYGGTLGGGWLLPAILLIAGGLFNLCAPLLKARLF